MWSTMGGIIRLTQQNKEKGLEKLIMDKKNEATREQARQILKEGICNISIARLIQMSQFGLKGNMVLSNETVSVENVFNHIGYDEENNVITFSVEESQGSYGAISFSVAAITEISGCEDEENPEENPEEYLDVNIKLEDDITIHIRILY